MFPLVIAAAAAAACRIFVHRRHARSYLSASRHVDWGEAIAALLKGLRNLVLNLKRVNTETIGCCCSSASASKHILTAFTKYAKTN